VPHVVLNALFLAPGATGGPETYLRGLAPALADARPDARFTVATTRSGAQALRRDGWGDRFTVTGLPCEDAQRLRRQASEQLLLPALALGRRADLVHSLASVAPIRTPGVRHVITLHDVTFFRYETFNPVTTWGMRQVVSRAARHADGLIAVTAAARDDICEVLSLDPADFSVVHHGVEPPKQIGPAPEDEVRRRYSLEAARVVLCVASKRPHKNQELLVRAAQLLDPDVVVVLAGHPEPYDAELRKLASELGVQSRLRFADYVPDPELEALWRMAGCAALPTLAEGFGFPLIEAMARGLPVAASDIPVLREVGGELPFWFDPHSPGSAAAAIRSALEDSERGPAGREWVTRYSWRAAAEGTWDAYERVLSTRSRRY
jgi:glycosyltransferase involved in cell wall biosynthesis